MPHFIEITGEIVDHLRAMRREGTRISALVRYLGGLDLGIAEIANYLSEAFCLREARPNMHFIARDASGAFVDEALDRRFEPVVEAARDAWFNATPYPDLMRRRDRHAFRKVARQDDLLFIVQAASRAAGRYVGQDTFRPFPLYQIGLPRVSPPHEGLIAADPHDPRLATLLDSGNDPERYHAYVAFLQQHGYHVGPRNEGYILRDEAGYAYYAPYYLHGVYHLDTGQNAWAGRKGERLRATLNTRMGADLILHGPHDLWGRRYELDPQHVLSGPQAPLLFFFPNGNVEVRHDAEAVQGYYRYYGIDWDTLYPHAHSAKEEIDG